MRSIRRFFSWMLGLGGLACSLAAFAPPAAPGPPGWQANFGFGGLNGTVQAVLPLRGQLIAAGDFTAVGGEAGGNYVARWDGQAWHALGAGPSLAGDQRRVTALAALPGGDLVAAAYSHDTVFRATISRWNGRQWQRLGPSFPYGVARALLVTPAGELLVGLYSSQAPELAGYGSGVLRWTGHRWQPLGPRSLPATALTSVVYRLSTDAQGQLLAAGELVTAAGKFFAGVGRWNGQGWVPLGPELPQVSDLVVLPDGTILAGVGATTYTRHKAHVLDGPDYEYTAKTFTGYVVRLAGDRWQQLGATFNNHVEKLLRLPGGALLASGSFTKAGEVPTPHLARWNGTQWQPLTPTPTPITTDRRALALDADGTVLASDPAYGLARWNATRWQALRDAQQAGLPGSVLALLATPGQPVLLGGDFDRTSAWGGSLSSWNGQQQPVGAAFMTSVSALARAPNGDVLAGGLFARSDSAGVASRSNVARWNGTRWQRLGIASPVQVDALAVAPNGDVLASGATGVARWNGTQWQNLGGLTTHNPLHSIQALAVLPNGDVVAGGNFIDGAGLAAADHVARWDGQRWRPMGAGLPGTVYALALTPSGELLAGGVQVTEEIPSQSIHEIGGCLSRWDGQRWQPVGPPLNSAVRALAVAGHGAVVAGGYFTDAGGNPLADRVACWQDGRWQALGPGVNDNVYALAVQPDGGILVGGGFTATGDASQPLHHFGLYYPAPPASR